MTTSSDGQIDLIRDPGAMHEYAERAACAGRRIALVPTMGALHDGHLRLVEEAVRHADLVAVSIFVNPTQFGPGEDFDAYPRDLRTDTERLRAQGIADVVFAPGPSDVYPGGEDDAASTALVWVSVNRLGEHLCGASRPGHFRGVTTIVTKLLIICRPHVAVFGLKDAQQFFMIRRLVEELHLSVDIVGVPTVREEDGLAMSSRNRYLTIQERREAVALSRAVQSAREAIEAGERDAEVVRSRMRKELWQATAGNVDYAEIVETDTLQPVSHLRPGWTVLAAVAVQFGEARLIDNAIVDVP